MAAVFGQAALEAVAPATGEHVLDVGCGAGASSLALAARVGAQGHVLGVDISASLIGRARALAPVDAPVRFQVADASSVELPEGAFDIVFSRFGVMFFDDPARAFAHLRQALRQQTFTTALRQYLQLLAGQAEVEGVDLEACATPLVQ